MLEDCLDQAFLGERLGQVVASAGLERIPVFVRADGPRAARWLAAFAGEGTDG